MRQLVAPKESHVGFCKGGKSFIKGQQGRFARKRIANQNDSKIDEVIDAKAGAGKAYLFLNCFQDSRV